MKWGEGSIIVALDPGTVAGLTDQLAHRVQEFDVVACQVVDELERWQASNSSRS